MEGEAEPLINFETEASEIQRGEWEVLSSVGTGASRSEAGDEGESTLQVGHHRSRSNVTHLSNPRGQQV